MNLLASTLWGGLYLLILFGICCGSVVGIKYLHLRMTHPENKPSEKKEEPPKPPTPPKEVYYIVEKKHKRTAKSYSDPKKINFE